MINIAIFVSGGGTNLQALIDAQNENKIQFGQIKLVISSNSEAYALKRAKKENIESCIIDPKNYTQQSDFENSLLLELNKHNIDLIVLAGWTSILSAKFVKKYPNKIINVHPSLIPSFCGKGYYGLKVHKAALLRGVKISGATVHFVNEICDGGEIIAQKAIQVMDDDTPETLQRRIMKQAEWILLPQAVADICKQLDKK